MHTSIRIKSQFVFILLITFSVSINFINAQDINYVTIVSNDSNYEVSSYNFEGTIYLSADEISNLLELKSSYDNLTGTFKIESENYYIELKRNSAFAIITKKKNNEVKSVQLPTSIHFINGFIFAPQTQLLSLLKKYCRKNLVVLNPGKMILVNELNSGFNHLLNIEDEISGKDEFIRIKTEDRISAYLEKYNATEYNFKINNAVSLYETKAKNLSGENVIDFIIQENNNDLDISFRVKSKNIYAEIIKTQYDNELLLHFYERESSDWYERESENFKVVYRADQTHLANHILNSAENALAALNDLFDYKPKDKIIIGLYDASDYGLGYTTTIPQNFLRLEVEPLEPGYEAITYSERYQWMISHELVHIIVNDQATGFEKFMRSLFGKVPPEKTQPTSILYSYLTNSLRYTPRWYQEGIAVYIETWLNGGYGRVLSSFDEMYFRIKTLCNDEFPSPAHIETIDSHNSFLLETLFYLYGTRFLSYLSIRFGYEKIIEWYKIPSGSVLYGYINRFEDVFGEDFDDAWKDFCKSEIEFQKKNLDILKASKITEPENLSDKPFGWVSQPFLDRKTNSVIYSYHRSHHLATLQSFNLQNHTSEEIVSLPTPSILQVASLAFDEETGLLFYTTNNNQLYRDVRVVDLDSRDEKMLFENIRIGDLAVSSVNKDLWGIQHESGLVTVLYSPYPYKEVIPVCTLPLGEELFQLSVDPSGNKITAVLRLTTGQQSIIVFDVNELKVTNQLKYEIISSNGTPENPTWSMDGSSIYWSAFTNGVSNIYKYELNSGNLFPLTNCLTGLFKPIEISPNKIFAFEFTLDGFTPVLIDDKPAERLPAINYLGQKVIENDPVLKTWNLPKPTVKSKPFQYSKETSYNGLSNLRLQSFYPVVSGFQNQVVFGFFTHISDPMLHNDFIMEFGFSPLHEKPSYPSFHLRFKYDYKQLFFIELSHHGPEFFDLFNDRKRGMLGTKITFNHNHYWLFDNPHKIKQTTALSLYTGVEYVNDNLVRVREPDFAVFVTSINSRSIRRSIGSSDFEKGTDLNFTYTVYGTKFDKPVIAMNSYIEFSNYTTWLWDHNVFHVKIAGGFVKLKNDLVQADFYFGGFGNRGLDNDEIKQFRRVFRFPGIPIYSVFTDRFIKFMIENDLPPLRLSGLELMNQYLNHIDFSLYSQSVILKSDLGNYWVDLGAQIDYKIKHWFNLESTFSMGIAKAWSDKMNDWEWFLSIKLLKD